MTDTFDRLLEPRETIVYRVPRRWEPNQWFKEHSALAIALAIAAALGLLRYDAASLASLAAAMAGLILYMLCCYVRDWSREALVTDRRLLYRTGWLDPTVVTVGVEDISKVEAVKDQVRITRHDGTKLDLGHPQDGWGMGVALASAAGLPPPRLAPRHEVVADYVWLVCGMAAGLVVALVPLKWLYPHAVEFARSIGWLIPATGFLFLGWFTHAIGILVFGGNLALLLLRPFLSLDQMDAWIMNSAAFWPHPSAPDDPGPEASIKRRFAHLLYGRPLAPQSGGSGLGG